STTENRSMRPLRRVCLAACDRAVGTAIVITPLAAGAAIGRMTAARRRPSFIPTVRSAPEWALRLHRVMRRRALAGFTADQGVTPLLRRPPPDYQLAVEPGPKRREITVADGEHAQVDQLLLDADKTGGLLRQQSLEQRRGGKDIFVRGDVIFGKPVGHDDIRPVQLLDLPDP